MHSGHPYFTTPRLIVWILFFLLIIAGYLLKKEPPREYAGAMLVYEVKEGERVYESAGSEKA